MFLFPVSELESNIIFDELIMITFMSKKQWDEYPHSSAVIALAQAAFLDAVGVSMLRGAWSVVAV